MTLPSGMTPRDFAQRLAGDGVGMQIGPFVVALRTDVASVSDTVYRLYADYPLFSPEGLVDFHIHMKVPSLLRHWFRPQIQFAVDDELPFKPLPFSQAYPFFEWGLNWCIAKYSNQYLILHAAVVEKNGKAVIMPAPPGSGKSTLCAGLVSRGWRLLSDELALLSLSAADLTPVPRPISLKNQSIDVISRFAPDVIMGPRCEDTSKGTVAHMKPPVESVARAGDHAVPVLVVLPRYVADSEAILEPLASGQMILQLVSNTFN